jgi:mRNA interferase MazF
VTFKRWDIVSVPFPFVVGHATKRRPALVLSTDALHRAHRVCFGAWSPPPATCRTCAGDDIEIADLDAAGLQQPCVIREARLATFEWGDHIRRVGALHRRERAPVATLLQRWFGI